MKLQLPITKTSSPGMSTLQAAHLQKKKAITVEDSMDVISELISKIQSTDKLDLNLPTHSPHAPKPTAEAKLFVSLLQGYSTSSPQDILTKKRTFGNWRKTILQG